MHLKIAKWMFKILVVSTGIIYLTSCKQESYSEKLSPSSVEISKEYDALPESEFSDSQSPQFPRNLKIIKSANVKYKVKNVKMATKTIKRMAHKYDAYISDLRFENSLYQIQNRFTVKIPQHHFDAVLDSIVKVAEFVDYEDITSDDVTEQYIDLQSRLNTKLEVKKRYETVLRKRAKTVKDILATEEKLRVIQEEIEAAQGKLNYLINKVAYSTVQIDLYETVDYKEQPVVYTKTFWSKSKEGVAFGWNLIETLFLGLLYIWPLLITLILTLFLWKRSRKKTKE